MISGLLRRPEEKIAYEENFLAQVIKKRVHGSEAGRESSRFPGPEEQAPADTPQPVAGRRATLEEPCQRGVPESLFPHTAVQRTVFRDQGQRDRVRYGYAGQ